MRAFKLCVLSAVFAFATATAEAYPILQLDILGGHYDPVTETVVSDGDTFTLVALLTPNGAPGAAATLLADTYYVSAAVSPQQNIFANNLGTFSWNGDNYDVTDDMTYGTPPLELLSPLHDGGDLGNHSVFPTFFREFSFTFSAANRTVSYNVADNPGGLTQTSATTGISYYAVFNVNTALTGNNVLHFDLYNDQFRSFGLDRDVDNFAPFSHDAESSSEKVPEPGSMLLMSMGLLIAGKALRRKKA